MTLRWLTPMRPTVFAGLLVYFFASCLLARIISGDSERITDPWAALVLALMAAVLTVCSIAPVESSRARTLFLRPDAILDSKWGLLFSGAVAAAFTGGFLLIAARGMSQGAIASSVAFAASDEARIDLDGGQIAIALEPKHPRLAEYNRTLIVRSATAPEIRIQMFPDTGGYSRTHLYSLSRGRYLVKGHHDSWVVNVSDRTILEIMADASRTSANTGEYMGAFCHTREGVWRFLRAAELADKPFSSPGFCGDT
jgi:hypothetical protein